MFLFSCVSAVGALPGSLAWSGSLVFKIVTLIQGVALYGARASHELSGAVRPDRRRRRCVDNGLRRLRRDAPRRREALVGRGGGAERRMLGFAGELLRVRRTRPGVSDQRFGALRPAFLRLKALSLSQRFLWSRAACSSSVRARCGRRGSGLSAGELAGCDDACGPSLRQQSRPTSASSARATISARVNAKRTTADFLAGPPLRTNERKRCMQINE